MAPTLGEQYGPTHLVKRLPVTKPANPDALVLEAWAQGFLVGSLVIMAAITIANMRRNVLLHKLILLELFLGCFHGTFIFNNAPIYGWYLSVTAVLLNISWTLHNVISWMKTKPFLSRRWSIFYIGTVILVQPYWIVEIYANFTYFNNINTLFVHTRPYEALFRDPWWIFSVLNLYWNLVRTYHLSIHTIVYISPRFGVLLVAMFLSICFILTDLCAVTGVFDTILPDGLNPFWKLAMVFKCLCDSIVLDDFKTALDRLKRYKLWRERLGGDVRPLGPTAGTADEVREEEQRMKAQMDPLGEDAAERGKSVATIMEERRKQRMRHEEDAIEEGYKPPLPRIMSSFDDIDLAKCASGSRWSDLKSPTGSDSTAARGSDSPVLDYDSMPSSSKRHSSMAG